MNVKCFLVLFIIGYIKADYLYSSSSAASCGFPHIDNGRVRVRQKSRLVKFICSPRYELVGNKYATCRGSQWDVPLPVCVRTGCKVPSIENGVEIPSRQNAWVVFFCLPGHKMIGSSTIYCDGRRWNGTAPSCVDATSSGLPKCDFEDPKICGWMQDDLHDFDWIRLNQKTPSNFLFTGPSYDHTYGKGGSGYYMYIESTSRLVNDSARLISPIYDGALAKDGCFVFFYHMYGETTGGLRVYQKPENYALSSLLGLSSSEKQKYILFEKWGNLGNVWYDAVLPLVDFSDNFQIVIEGLRGSSFTSDIAIDDVAILQGSNCSVAQLEATTPSEISSDSCTGRCDLLGKNTASGGCTCAASCIRENNCCIDFFDTCVFSNDGDNNNDDNSSNSTEIAPQTQKLIASTPFTTSTTTTLTPKTTSTTRRSTTSTTTTTAKPTTTTSTTTTTTTTTTTPKTTTTTSTTTTKPVTNVTKVTKIATTITPKPTTQPTTKLQTTIKTTSPKIQIDYSFTPIQDVFQDEDDNGIKDEENTDKEQNTIEYATEPTKSGSLKTGLISILAILCCIGLIWLLLEVRSSRGRRTLARIRGHVTSDPEVRYLSTDVDDD
ncbi:PREDICTED: MAM and LDL-receptor class A domain-containing protein 2-like [Papilio polytes]|uniref:MAM and LDL-receptor class A domain-containing protein 2-like n=1 Tax=Papilio polytes TaxID=76194 RepID=UPI0006763D00|nr:PREDICTED: MAM and LDL-receptor class A domain-containing protein 2-like [Papilio polytes]